MNDPKPVSENETLANEYFDSRVSVWDEYIVKYDENKRHPYVFYLENKKHSIASPIICDFYNWWQKIYKIRDTNEFKEEFKRIDYCYGYCNLEELPEGLEQKYWMYVSGLVLTIYHRNPSYYDSKDTFARNVHPLNKEELQIVRTICGHDEDGEMMWLLLPRTQWCARHIGSPIYSRCDLPEYGVKSGLFERKNRTTTRGKSRVKLSHLLYTLTCGSIPQNETLVKDNQYCRKDNCINPYCFCTGPIHLTGKRKRGKSISDENRVRKMLTDYPTTFNWIENHLDELRREFI